MNSVESIKVELAKFIEKDKFLEYQHLQPAVQNSTDKDKAFVNNEMNKCCSELLQNIQNNNVNEDDLRNIVSASLDRIENSYLDTEDREFSYELFFIIGNILGIELQDKSTSQDEKMFEELKRLAEKAGINLNDFLPPNSLSK